MIYSASTLRGVRSRTSFLRHAVRLFSKARVALLPGLSLFCLLSVRNAGGACPLPPGTNDPPALMDFDLDGKADILWRNKATGEDVIWLMHDTNFFRPVILTNIAPGSPWVMAGIGDFDNDGKNDILWHFQKPGDPNNAITAFWKMDGTNWTVQSRSFFLNANYTIRGAADFNRDGYCDIIWEDISTGVKGVQYMGADFQPSCSKPFGEIYHMTNWQMSATADLNGDHIPDIVLRDQTGGQVALWFMEYDSTNGLQVNSMSLLWDTTPHQPGLFLQPDQDWNIVGAGNFHSWKNGNVDLLLRHATLGLNGFWTINGTNLVGKEILENKVYDTNWRIASQDVADSTWALQGANRPRLTATVSASPLGITLTYTNSQNPDGRTMTVQRMLAMETNWTTIATNLGPPFNYTDTNVSIGVNYDYQVFDQSTTAKTAIVSGINVPPVENRGKIILLVDKELATQFPAQMKGALSELASDLVGDGWTIIQTNVARHDDNKWSNNTNNIVSIRAYVSNSFKLDMVNTKGVFIIGHVPIPYSGTTGPDGHTPIVSPPDHQGAWPADGYYGDIDGTWTDTNSYSNASFPANSNDVGDGKFDQNIFPSWLELFVGRVDFANLPSFGTTVSPTAAEANLIRQYFDKTHKFRFALAPYPLPLRASVYSYIAANPAAVELGNGVMFRNGMRNAAAFFGAAPTNLVVADAYSQRPNADPQSYVWGFDAGAGNTDSMDAFSGIGGTSAALASSSFEPNIGFYLLYGSYFGDWNKPNDFMRATIATPTYGLTTIWTAANCRLHGMAMGEPIGFSMIRTINNLDTSLGTLERSRVLSIMGDPTLRLHTLASPSGFVGHPGSGCVNFSWNAVPGVQYRLYKGPSANGPFTLLSADPVQNSTSDCPFPGSFYMLRALQLVTSGTGAYTNISQGVFWH